MRRHAGFQDQWFSPLTHVSEMLAERGRLELPRAFTRTAFGAAWRASAGLSIYQVFGR